MSLIIILFDLCQIRGYQMDNVFVFLLFFVCLFANKKALLFQSDCSRKYSTAQVVFQNPPRTGGVDFLAHRGSS